MSMTKVYDGKLSTVTVNAMRVTNALLTGCDVKYPQKSTMNEHLNLFASKMPDGKERPTLKYMCIGNKGHTAETASDGVIDMIPWGKKASYSGMFNIMPLVLRTLENDLSDEQRKSYAGRRKETHSGRQYWAYYYKLIDLSATTTTDNEISKVNGVDSIKEFKYTDNELFPKPGKLPDYDYDDDTSTTAPDGKYVMVTSTITIPWSDFDVSEYMNVNSILRGSPRSSVISEIALCSGVTASETGESATGSKFSYNEALGVQALYYIDLFTNLAVTNDRLALTIRIGQPAPFFLGTA